MDALALKDFQNSLIPHRETFADVGEVQMYVYDMHTVWERLKDRVRIEVRPEDALVVREYIFPVPPSICWEYMTKPEFRALVLGASAVELRNLKQGRSAVDSVYYCYHGKMETSILILDWQPFEQYTTDGGTPLGVSFSMTFKLEPIEGGTRVINLWGKARGAWIRRKLNDLLQKMIFVSQNDKGYEKLRQCMQQDLANGTAFISPLIEVDKTQIASLATQALTHDH